MFQAPLGIRSEISPALPTATPFLVDSLIYNDILYILLLSEKYAELLSVPLLANKSETRTLKIIFPLDGKLLINNGNVSVIIATDNKIIFYDETLNVINTAAHKLINPKITLTDSKIFLYSKNMFYRFEFNKLKKLNISPFYYNIERYTTGTIDDGDIIIYYSHGKYSIFRNGSAVIGDIGNGDVFIAGNQILVISLGKVNCFKLMKQGKYDQYSAILNQKIDTSIRYDIKWEYCKYDDGILLLSGYDNKQCVIYVDGYLFNTTGLITSFQVYKNCFFGFDGTFLYFLPNDEDFGFELNNEENDENISILKYTPECTGYEMDGIAGEFMGCLLYHGFKIQIRKMIFNILNGSEEPSPYFLLILNELNKFDYKIYKIFVGNEFSIKGFYNQITFLVPEENFNFKMLIKALELEFREIGWLEEILIKEDNDLKNSYFYIKGVNQYYNNVNTGNAKGYIESFLNLTSMRLRAVNFLMKNFCMDVIELVNVWGLDGVDVVQLVDLICEYSPIVPKLLYSKLLGRVFSKEEDLGSELRNEMLKELVGWGVKTENSGLTNLIREFKDTVCDLIYETRHSNIFFAGKALFINGDLRGYPILYSVGTEKALRICYDFMEDYVFIYEREFIDKEKIKRKLEYKIIKEEEVNIKENIKKLRSLKPGCVWTHTYKAGNIEEYLKELKKAEDIYFNAPETQPSGMQLFDDLSFNKK
ncbi:hypothetical protein TCON_0715 [Astathelohania contejeani]|uniref:Uncharacterized protein n=1 Tax=Astathelohania contejeani TaxID=164912 RepID=A0ABQ7I0X4_9MICR|nr:hypothetical protein TCON_0715 [Thelohania contejeani]